MDLDQEGFGKPAPSAGTAPRDARVIGVSTLLRAVRDLLDQRIPPVWVTGEISNFTAARSGHWYFVLKDAQAQVRCVMFRGRNQLFGAQPRDGMQVDARATATIYEARGDLQLVVESMRQGGLGALYEQFLRLRDRLAAEGLFRPEAKRPLPAHPRAVGVISSLAGAALHDILTTLRRRNPCLPVIVYPAAVQGAAAAGELRAAIAAAGARGEVDVVILARGGGSIEDLWSFNDEQLARAIRACPVPVISGVGHETDFTIADFAADMRAPTPTAAAELVSRPVADLVREAAALLARIGRALRHRLEREMQHVDGLAHRVRHPAERIAGRRAALDALAGRLVRAARERIDAHRRSLAESALRLRRAPPGIPLRRAALERAVERLRAASMNRIDRTRARVAALERSVEHLAPQRVLERGYSLALDASGRLVSDAARLAAGDSLEVRFARGSVETRVEAIRPDGE